MTHESLGAASHADHTATNINSPAHGLDPVVSEVVLALKQVLDIEINPTLAPHIIGSIVTDMLDNTPTERGRSEVSRELQGRVAYLAALWGMHVQRALSTPGSEWPEDISPLSTFTEALGRLNGHDDHAGRHGDLPGHLGSTP
jgi:hypothetical protein